MSACKFNSLLHHCFGCWTIHGGRDLVAFQTGRKKVHCNRRIRLQKVNWFLFKRIIFSPYRTGGFWCQKLLKVLRRSLPHCSKLGNSQKARGIKFPKVLFWERHVHGSVCPRSPMPSLQECVMLYPWRVFFYRHETPNLDWNAEFRNAESDRRKDPLGVAFLSHWGAEEEV